MKAIISGASVVLIATALVSADAQSMPADEKASRDLNRIAAALLPLPEALRGGATVVSVEKGVTTVLRTGSNGMVCTADQPDDQVFFVNCFHETVREVMLRSNELRRSMSPNDVQAAIDKEIKGGKLKVPLSPSMGFQMRGPLSGYDPSTNTVSKGIDVWQMVILPHATGASLSLPETPQGTMPWVMEAGTWSAHIMILH